jgi:hypothetical protein
MTGKRETKFQEARVGSTHCSAFLGPAAVLHKYEALGKESANLVKWQPQLNKVECW